MRLKVNPPPWVLRFALTAVSPAVVVPSLLTLSDAGYGLDKGIPTLVIAAATIDDVFNITGFGVLLGIVFSQGTEKIKRISSFYQEMSSQINIQCSI